MKKISCVALLGALVGYILFPCNVMAATNQGPVYYMDWQFKGDAPYRAVRSVEGKIFQEDRFDIAIKFSNDTVVYPTAKYKFLMIDGEFITDSALVTEANRTLAPLRVVAEKLNATVGWDSKTSQVKISKDDTNIILTIGSSKAVVNGKTVSLDVPAKLIDSKTYVPLRFVSENLNGEVEYNDQLSFTNYPVVSIENKANTSGSIITKEQAVAITKKMLSQHLTQWIKENGAQDQPIGLDETLQSVQYANKFSRFWILSCGNIDPWECFLVDQYTGDVYYFRGAYQSFWVASMDYGGFLSLFFAG